ncbi:MAG: ABC transporter related [Caldanaerobacter subterraneus]|nr:MAG: ABC transporter related [Caldanaerobacter subterraneus]
MKLIQVSTFQLFQNDVKIVEEDYFNNFFRLLGSAVGFVAALISLFILKLQNNCDDNTHGNS